MKRRRTESHDDNANQMKLWDIVMIAGSLGLTLFVCICAGVADVLLTHMPERRHGA